MAARPSRLILLLAALSAIGAAQPTPRRIVSLVPAVTEMLFAVGAGSQVVAVSSYDRFPATVDTLPRIGALLDPDLERILALRPDLAVTYGSQTDLQAQLARAGVRTLSYRHAGLAGIFLTLEEIGTAVNRPMDAARLARDLRARLDAIGVRVRGQRPVGTLLVFERDPGTLRGLYVSGGRGFLHDMLAIAGGRNVFADVDRESVQPSQETLIARAPEVILEVRATGYGSGSNALDRERAAWASLQSIPAVRAGRIHLLGGDDLVVPGPRVAAATERFARALHPEVFR